MTYSKMHISIRVPWHDTGWDGRVCLQPQLNASCLRLRRIGQERNDTAEMGVAGKYLKDLSQDQWPCCVAERVGFMAPFEYTRIAEHPYKRSSEETHGHFVPSALRHPAYSAPAVPFAWMLVKEMATYVKRFNIDVQPDREPDLGFKTQWVQDRENQKALLDCFCNHLEPEQSLCFFYAKEVPFVNDPGTRRILIGVGRVLHVSPCIEYKYEIKNLKGKLRSMLWERMVQHSIRPDFKDGFILPYHQAIKQAESDSDFDPATIAAFSPEDRLLEFSHASQLVTHDGALSSLYACAQSLRMARYTLPGPWDKCLQWIDQRVGELWQARGPCPGLGSALFAFGIEQGNFVAQAVLEKVGENEDPWPYVDQVFSDPKKYLPHDLTHCIGNSLRIKWKRLPEVRRHLLQLLSRFEITSVQSTMLYVPEERQVQGITCTDKEILANPYILYENTRLTADPISIWTVDRGVFPDEVVRKKHPLPEPTALDSGTDARRVRALSVNVLEEAVDSGHTLLPQKEILHQIRNLPFEPRCQLDQDLLDVSKDLFEDVITEVHLVDESGALQLSRLSDMGKVIRSSPEKRVRGKRLSVDANWSQLLTEHLKTQGVARQSDEIEEKAHQEKTFALKELAESRLSVLIGPAGTGKTTLLSVLCSQPKIAEGGILLLAPTGKARVRMEQSAKSLKLQGKTIAQFLCPQRYDPWTGRYRLSDKPAEVGARTVIIDEASMLTEEMLAALIQSLKGVDRLILIGDHRQLPPIGTGRPFVDIVHYLAPEKIRETFPRVKEGYAELTIRHRQAGEEREDLQLAEWFSGSPMPPGEDDVFDKVIHVGQSKHVRFVEWNSPEDLQKKLIEVLVEELRLNSPTDALSFEESLGGKPWNGSCYFNMGAAEKSESWQILSPIRTGPHGVPNINHWIHRQFREEMVEKSRKEKFRKFTKPMGPEEIVYGDKVINLVNTDPTLRWFKHRKVYPSKDSPYIANGEIGMAIGYFWSSKDRERDLDFRWKLEVEFSSQPGYKYDFTSKDFGEESSPVLELAYALTVHKSQGSEFGTVFLILPNPCRLLSRELLYTALTRQKDRVVILHQGKRNDIKKFSSDDRSETARRLTNLFTTPSPITLEGNFFEESLIHRTSKGEMVRSKSEVIIADRLSDLDVEYAYERPLTIESTTKYPDFTIEDMESGRTFYWEHCGMMSVPAYRRRWEEKLDWYRSHGIFPYEEGDDENGTLIVTSESSETGISSQEIERIIRSVILGE